MDRFSDVVALVVNPFQIIVIIGQQLLIKIKSVLQLRAEVGEAGVLGNWDTLCAIESHLHGQSKSSCAFGKLVEGDHLCVFLSLL